MAWDEIDDHNTEKVRQTYHFNKDVIKAIDSISDKIGWSKSDLVNRAIKFYIVEGIVDDPKIIDSVDQEFATLIEYFESERTITIEDIFWEELEEKLGIIYDESEDRLSIPDPPSNSIPKFVEFMFDNGYMSVEDIPFKPSTKHKNNRILIMNNPDKHSPHSPEKIQDGVWVETRYSRKYAERYIREICHKFGVGNHNYVPYD